MQLLWCSIFIFLSKMSNIYWNKKQLDYENITETKQILYTTQPLRSNYIIIVPIHNKCCLITVHVEWITFFIVSKITDTNCIVRLLTSHLLDNIHALCFFVNSCTLINR